MRKIFLIVLSLVIVSMFIVGCGEKVRETVELADEGGNMVGAARYTGGKYRIDPASLQNICKTSLASCESKLKELQRGVKYRLFEEDWTKMGYQLQFQEKGAVVAAFGIVDVVDSNNLVIELSGKGYNDAQKNIALGETISLTAKDSSKTYNIIINDIEFAGGSVDVEIQE